MAARPPLPSPHPPEAPAPLRLDPGRRRGAGSGTASARDAVASAGRSRHAASHRAKAAGRGWADETTKKGDGGRDRGETMWGRWGGASLFFFFNYYFLTNRSVRTSAEPPRATFALLKVTTRRQAARHQRPGRKGRGDRHTDGGQTGQHPSYGYKHLLAGEKQPHRAQNIIN